MDGLGAPILHHGQLGGWWLKTEEIDLEVTSGHCIEESAAKCHI